MKKILLTLIIALAVLSIGAQEESAALARMSAALRDKMPYRIDFTVTTSDAGFSKGFFIVDGNRYRIEIEDMHQFSDGNMRYTVGTLEREITVDAVDVTSRNLLENPVRAFDFDTHAFTVRIVSSNNSTIEAELTPAAGVLDGINHVRLRIDAETMLPLGLTYDLGGTELTVDIDAVESVMPDRQMFDFDESLYNGYEVIEMMD